MSFPCTRKISAARSLATICKTISCHRSSLQFRLPPKIFLNVLLFFLLSALHWVWFFGVLDEINKSQSSRSESSSRKQFSPTHFNWRILLRKFLQRRKFIFFVAERSRSSLCSQKRKQINSQMRTNKLDNINQSRNDIEKSTDNFKQLFTQKTFSPRDKFVRF